MHANKFYKEKLNGNNNPLTINNFPSTLQIYDADINIAFNLEKQGILWCTSLGSKLLLQKLITDNTKDNTGFLMWISNYCFSCIFQHNNMKTKAKRVKYYIIRFSPNGTTFQSKIREGPYYICSVCNRILYRKTVIQLKKQMFNTQQELFTELYTHDSFPSWNHLSPDGNLFWNRCMPLPDLSSLFQYTSPTPVVSLQLIPRIQYHPGIPVTLLTGSSF